MTLPDFLASLNLSLYTPALTAKGFGNVEDLTALSEPDLEYLFVSVSMLKGHSLKLRKSLEDARRSEPSLIKKPRLEEQSQMPTKPVQAAHSPSKPYKANSGSLTKDVERLMARLAEIEQARDDLEKARDLILSVDLARYHRALNQVEFIQNTLGAMEEDTGEKRM